MSRTLLEKTFVLQHDETDCGAACLLSLIRYYGGDSSVAYLREISGTSMQGTALLGLYQAAGKMGFKADGCEADVDALIEHGRPVILHILTKQNMEHYIVCYKYGNGKFLIGDPGVGLCESGLLFVAGGSCRPVMYARFLFCDISPQRKDHRSTERGDDRICDDGE